MFNRRGFVKCALASLVSGTVFDACHGAPLPDTVPDTKLESDWHLAWFHENEPWGNDTYYKVLFKAPVDFKFGEITQILRLIVRNDIYVLGEPTIDYVRVNLAPGALDNNSVALVLDITDDRVHILKNRFGACNRTILRVKCA